MNSATSFCQVKGCQVTNFRSFAYQISINVELIQGVFFYTYSPKYSPILVKFLTGCSIYGDKNRASTIFWKIWIFKEEFCLRMYTFCPFLGQIYSQKTENIAKKYKFSIKYWLRAIKNFQNYLKKLGEIKNKKTTILRSKIGLYSTLGMGWKVHRNSHMGYSIRIYL